jgi:hypothetical protein
MLHRSFFFHHEGTKARSRRDKSNLRAAVEQIQDVLLCFLLVIYHMRCKSLVGLGLRVPFF